VVLPDALALTVYMLRQSTALADGLVLFPERAMENLTVTSLGLVFSQSVLLALVDAGRSRDDAYRIVQAAARQAVEQRRGLRDVLEEDDQLGLSRDALDRAFDGDRLILHRGRFLDALTWRA
jgi:adenylosuccinate lyase